MSIFHRTTLILISSRGVWQGSQITQLHWITQSSSINLSIYICISPLVCQENSPGLFTTQCLPRSHRNTLRADKAPHCYLQPYKWGSLQHWADVDLYQTSGGSCKHRLLPTLASLDRSHLLSLQLLVLHPKHGSCTEGPAGWVRPAGWWICSLWSSMPAASGDAKQICSRNVPVHKSYLSSRKEPALHSTNHITAAHCVLSHSSTLLLSFLVL